MDTLDRSPARTTPSKRVENVGYALVAVGYAVMTLGILEVGGLFNVVVGLAGAWTGCVLMFLGKGGGTPMTWRSSGSSSTSSDS